MKDKNYLKGRERIITDYGEIELWKYGLLIISITTLSIIGALRWTGLL